MVETSIVGNLEHLAHVACVESPRYRSVDVLRVPPIENSDITIRCITPAPAPAPVENLPPWAVRYPHIPDVNRLSPYSIDRLSPSMRVSPSMPVSPSIPVSPSMPVSPSIDLNQINNPNLSPRPTPSPDVSFTCSGQRSRCNSYSSSSSSTSIGDPLFSPDSRSPTILTGLVESQFESECESESEPGPVTLSSGNIMVSKRRLQELEYMERNIEALVAKGLEDYIRNEGLNLEAE